MSKLDIGKPWIKVDVPNLRHDFNTTDPFIARQMQDVAKQQGSQGSNTSPTYDFDPPPPPDPRQQSDEEIMMRLWLKQQWLAAMAGAAKRAEMQEDHVQNYYRSQQQKETDMTQQSRNPNAPLQTFKSDGVNVKLWEQNKGDTRFVTASLGKTYRDRDGNFREGRSFTQADLQKLSALLPEANQEMQRLQEQYRGLKQEQQAPQQGMVAARDAAMQGAKMADQQQPNTQEHAIEQNHDHTPTHSR